MMFLLEAIYIIVTITGTATVATNIFRDYTLTFTSATSGPAFLSSVFGDFR